MRTAAVIVVSCLILAGSALADFKPTSQPISPDGTSAVVDLPASQHMRNVGGSDGLGLCVFTSIQHASYWQNIATLEGFRAWMQRRPGGGWPQKVDECLAQFSREKGVTLPPYIQHTGGDESFLELALKTDRMPCVTYDGRDDFYKDRWGRPAVIAHMVNLAHLDNERAAIIDNNRPSVWVWMTRAEFLSRWRGNGGGWAVVFLADPPPPKIEAKVNAVCICGDDCKCGAGECPSKCPTRKFEQCPNGRCPLPSVTPTVSTKPIGEPPSAEHEWGQFPNGEWGWKLKPKDAGITGDNFGVNTDKIHSHPRYSISGHECDKDTAHKALRGSLTDDSDRWHLTCVGDSAARKQFLADVAALPPATRGKLLVQDYAPDHWTVSLYSLPAGVSLRKPSPVRTAAQVGVVPTSAQLGDLLAMDGGPNYTPPPTPKPEPKPSPEPTPQPGPTPTPAPVPQPMPSNNWLLILLVGAAVWLLSRRRS